MAFTNDHSGMVGFLVGIIVLVFTGIVLSLAVDRRLDFSSGRASLQQEVATAEDRLITLRDQARSMQEDLKERGAPREKQAEQIAGLRSALHRQGEAGRQLEHRREELTKEIAAQKQAFAEYRTRYRQQVRAAGNGEKLAQLVTRNGKTYTNVLIQQVTSIGLSIRHDQGVSRIAHSELGPEWSERFQWDSAEADDQRQAERQAENDYHKAVEQATGPKPAPVLTPREKQKVERELAQAKLNNLRQNVADARTKLLEAESQANEARSQASSSRGRSVPGSLETWAQRASRLDDVARNLRKQYRAAVSELQEEAPRDPLVLESALNP